MRKNFLRLLSSLLLIALTASGAWAIIYGQPGYELEGYSEETAWEINSAAVLAKVRDDVNSGNDLIQKGYFKLTKDIDLTSYTDWEAIGSYPGGWSTESQFFNGHFDGNGHTIKVKISKIQLTSELWWESFCGVFGVVIDDGSIKNLNVEGSVSFSARALVERYLVGGIAAYLCGGTIENCKFDGSVTATQLYDDSPKMYAGGIVGYAGAYGGFYANSAPSYFAIVKNCKVGSKSATTIKANGSSASPYAGGITAYFEDEDKRSVMSGNWAKVKLNAGSNGNTGAIFAGRSGLKGKVSNNTEVDPNEPDEPLKISGTFKATTVKASYSGTASVTGGKSTYTWTKSGTASWLKLSSTKGAKVTLKGTPTEAGNYTLKLKVTDSSNKTLTKSFTIKVTAPSISGTFKGATLNTNYSGSATVSGGAAPYVWTKSNVPDGMTYKASGAKVTLSGKPNKKGTYKFKITAKDNNGASISKTFNITVAAKPTISGTFKGATLNTAYKGSAKVTGGTAPYTWKQSGKPDGLTFKGSGANATLTGKPTKVKNYTFKLTVTDANGASATKSFTIKVVAKPSLTGTFGAGTVGKAYNGSAKVTGGTAPYTWKQSGKPDGLTFKGAGANATLTGDPEKAKNYTFKLTITDVNGASATKSFTIKISAASTSAIKFSGTFPNGTEDEYYDATVKISGGTAPYTLKKSGNLPDGLKFSKNSKGTAVKLSGTPTDDGKYTFKLTATDSKGLSLTKSFTVTIIDNDDDDDFEDFSIDFKDAQNSKAEKDNSYNSYEAATTELKILSDDILSQGEGKDEDMFDVRADLPVRFIIGKWTHGNGAEAEIFAEDIEIYIDDKFVEGIKVSDEGEFTIPAEFVKGDFKVQAKAKELETTELFISAIN